MQAKKCDRCGKLYELYKIDKNVNGTYGIEFFKLCNHGKYDTNLFELCPDCKASLDKWLKENEQEEK